MNRVEASEQEPCIVERVIPCICRVHPCSFLPAACKSSFFASSCFVWLKILAKALAPVKSNSKYFSALGPNKGRLDLVRKEECHV